MRTKGIPDDAFVRVVREDPNKKGLLYAGTETGLYLSDDGGKSWQPFQLNLPVTPITDLTIRNNDLVASTQGRAFWILDDLTPLHQYDSSIKKSPLHLFEPRTAYRTSGGSGKSTTMGQNPPSGAVLLYHLSESFEKDAELKLEVISENGDVVRTITNKGGKSSKIFGGSHKPSTIPAKQGMNRFVWNFRIDDLTTVPDVSFYGGYSGYRVGPGDYIIQLTLDDKTVSQPLTVQNDPRMDIRGQDTKAHQELMADLYDQINDLHASIVKARSIRGQIQTMNKRLKEKDGMDALIEAGQSAIDVIDQWEGNVMQTDMETFQDVVNFLNRLNSHMINLLQTIDGSDPPLTQGQRERYADLMDDWDMYKEKFENILNNEVNEFNTQYKAAGLPAVIIPN